MAFFCFVGNAGFACLGQEQDRRTPAEAAGSGVSLEQVQQLVEQKQVGRTEGTIGRINICKSEKYRDIVGISEAQIATIEKMLASVELPENELRDIAARAKRGNATTASIVKPLVDRVKSQLFEIDFILETELGESSYRKLIAIQAFIQGPKAFADEIIGSHCELKESLVSKLRKHIRNASSKYRNELRQRSEGQAMPQIPIGDLLIWQEDLDRELWSLIPEPQRKVCEKLIDEGRSLSSVARNTGMKKSSN